MHGAPLSTRAGVAIYDPDVTTRQDLAQAFAVDTTGALGRTTFSATRDLAPFSQGAAAAADNLVSKALDALANGDRDRADRLLVRAACLPYDEHEEGFPGLDALTLGLFCLVTDECDACEADDDAWLRAAFTALPELDDVGSRALLDVLRVVDKDYGLPARESARIRRALPRNLTAPDDVAATATTEELAAIMRSIAQACLAYTQAAERAFESQ